MNTYTQIIVDFINRIGITCIPQKLAHNTFLPGIDIQNGAILYDPEHMKFPGDLLHEAGHLAVLLPEDRKKACSPDKLFGDLQEMGAELGAIAWSWAAITELSLPPEIVFHPTGYRGSSESYITNFSNGCYIGDELLQWMSMTKVNRHNRTNHAETYPKMTNWLRPEKADLS
jgi:hypothetical protein